MKLRKPVFLVTFTFFFFTFIHAQKLNNYLPPIKISAYKTFLGDTLHIELFVPREKEQAPDIHRPVIFLFDQQHTVNFQYQLQTIDYLTSLASMPPVVIAGIFFPPSRRTRWTIPNSEKGMADSLLSYLFGPFRKQLSQHCRLSDFTVLIGHSRTAMLSQYALAAFPNQVHAVIAASNSFFDFNTLSQQSLFESYCRDLLRPGTPRFFYFSSGTEAAGDTHESSVDQLVSFLGSYRIPARLNWYHYKEKATHLTTPGLTAARALNNLFSPLNEAMQASFDVLNKPTQTDSLPWSIYLEKWQTASAKIGTAFPPSLVFFNSIASGYLNDYNDQYKKNKYRLTQLVLEKAIQYYPAYPGFYSFYASVCLEAGDKAGAGKWIAKAKQILLQLKGTTAIFREEESLAIKEIEEALRAAN